MEKTISGITLECIKGDIARQKDIKAVVNAANAELTTGGGVAGALHQAAGTGLEEECKSLAPIKPGEAVITDGHKLPNKYVIHCLGPVFGQDQPENEILAKCYQNVLQLCEKHKIESVAFPAISTGAFGYPIQDATDVAFKTILEMIPKLEFLEKIRFVLYADKDLEIYKENLFRHR
ncbi:macro domain-containing protein [Psychroflexus aestuariivivens]|uniref:macro domain-containing protein n=1 Tax=Psychroflexus aestuariivivens TaxID=1795040 RepID=UPI000FDA683D|nr:macro domain-containing protein [Psychroflexus aestuariivivens]